MTPGAEQGPSRVTRVLSRLFSLHPWLYEKTNGRIGYRLGSRRALLLHTTGARSGQRRTVALTYVDDGDRQVVVASNGGSPRHPAWFHNLSAHPECDVQIGRRRERRRARVVTGAERERLFQAADEMNKGGYTNYAARTSREIPVVVLEPIGDGTDT